MKNFMIFTQATDFIEHNLCGTITRSNIAAHCHVSLSMLEKLFSYTLHMGISDYMLRRRMTRAARDLVSGCSVTELAMKYGYNSVEAFSRAFRRVWRVNPSGFAAHWRFTGLFPRIEYADRRDGDIMATKKLDISDAYEFLRSVRGCCALCFDIHGLLRINAISRHAGDLALIDAAARIDAAADDTMLLLRIGNDEFVLVTPFTDDAQAQTLADSILSHNGEAINGYEGEEIPLSLWYGLTHVPDELSGENCARFLDDSQRAIKASKPH